MYIMALQVWLPLNGNANNQGLCGNSLTTSNLTFADGGKIGAKYLSGGTITIPAAISKKIFNKNNMSFAFWLCPTGTSGANKISGQSNTSPGNNRMYTIYQWSTENNLHLSWQDETSSSTFLAGHWTGFFPSNTWTHFCVTYNGSTAIVYRNGVQFTTVSGTSNRSSFEYDYPIIGSNIRKLNDFRIYDHCLSPREVHEISQALVLHYRLDDIYTNTYSPVYDCSGYGNNGTVTGKLNLNTDTPRYNYSTLFNSQGLISTTSSGSYILTISIWAKDNGSIPSDGLMFKDHLGDMALGIQSNTLYSGKSGGQGAGSTSISNISYTTNTWHHWVMVNRNSTYYVYMDGKHVLTGTSGCWSAGSINNALHIGGRSGSSPWPGSLSDFRAYATALSADDIKSLYNVGAIIDNGANMHTYEYHEIESTTPKVHKTGVTDSSSLLEPDSITNASFSKAGIIKAKNFYEI